MSGEWDDERRRETRVALNAPVRLSTIDPETDPGTGRPFFRSTHELCANVSRSGLFVRTAEPFEPGRRLLVELTLPDGNDLDAVGRVAWIKRSLDPAAERGVGIEILGGSPEQLASLQAFVARHARARRRRSGGARRSG